MSLSESGFRPEDDFLCWRQDRDPRVLARVFDATAAGLLLLAVHVTREEHQAEELVQATFLAAMEAAGRYEAGKPLLPWLGGILHNIARNHWRARARRREQALGDEPRDTAAGPVEQLADRETTEQVIRIIEELPRHYRQVLNLRLVHGLKNVDIAHSLGIPVGTVRARVHRGLDILRAALPAGLTGAMLVLLEGQGLAAVRKSVVGKAMVLAAGTAAGVVAATASLSGASTFAGALLMKKVALVAATAAALFLGWHYWPDEIPAPSTAEDSKGTVTAKPDRWAAEQEPASPPGRDSRVALAMDGHNANAKGLPGWHLHGIVRSGGVPVPGATVRIEIERGGVRDSLARVRTDSEGRYQVDLRSLQESPLLLLATGSIYARAEAAGHWPGDSMFVSKELASLPATHVFTRDLALTRGPTVTGRIVDPRGKPVADAAVRVVERTDKTQRTPRNTDKDGRFEVAVPDTTDDLWLVAGKPDVGIASKSLGSVSTGTDVGDVQLLPHGTLSGQVVLEDGDAYPHAELIILRNGTDDEYAWTRGQCPRLADGVLLPHDALLVRCDAQGRFQVAGLRTGGYQIAVRRTLQPYANAQAQAGDDSIRIVVPGQLLTLRVTDQEKRPLPGALVVLTGWSEDQLSKRGFAETSRPPVASLGLPSGHHTQAVQHATGELHWILPLGSYWNIRHRVDHAVPRSESWRVMRGVHRARIELALAVDDSGGRLRIAILDEVGNPVPQWQVSLRMPETKGFVRSLQPSQLGPDGRTPLLPASRYLATIESGPRVGGQRPNAELNTEVRVVANRVMDWTVRVQRRGLLRLTLLPPNPQPAERWHGLRVTVEPGGRDENPTLFGIFDQLTPDGMGHDTKTSPLVGRKLVCPGNLAPGRRVVRISCRGFHDVLAPVDVAPGEIADLEVTMIPR